MNLARPLKGCPVAVIDTETTGLDPSTAHIVEVAVVHTEIGSDDASVAWASLVKPPIAIPADSTRITGIDDAMVADAPTWAEVVPLMEAACSGRVVVAFNAPYDYRIVRAENGRIGAITMPWPWLDLLVVRKATKTRGRPGRLAEIAEEYGIGLEAHGASGDALVTGLLLTRMLRRAFLVGGFHTLGDLFAWQRGAALAQERDYAAYCQKRGDALPPSCGWHDLEEVPAPTWERRARTMHVARDGSRAA